MEIDVQRQERITAPISLVWEEIDSLDQILAKSPQIFRYEVVPGGQRAGLEVHLNWGPVKWAVEATMALAEVRRQEHIGYTINAPSLEVRCDASIDLSPVGTGEVLFVYQAHLECRHRLAGRMRGLFSDILEDHMVGIVNRTKVRSEQRRLAQDRLSS